MMAVNVNVTKVDSSNSISLTKGASQQSLNTAVSQALSYRDTSVASAESATQSEANALGYANNANTYATNASASASSASASEIASALSETNASISATSAANSATTANSERLLAEAAELSASNSSTLAQGYANDALGYRDDAQTAASNASTSEANASTSETNASAYASSASTSEINASASATAASLSETNASASELSASNSATTATTQASIATTQATNASNSASAAATSEANAGISESNAALSESNAATSEANAAISETNANNSATSAANSLATFQGQYVSSATEPTSPDVGDLWYDEITSLMKVYDGTIWQLAGSSVNGTSSRNTYTSTQGQTTFSATYDVGYVDVYVNGLKLQDTIDFTATDGTNVVLASGVNAGDIIDIVAYGTFALADVYTQAQADSLLADKVDKVSSTDNAIVRFDGTTGQVQNSGVVIDDSGNIISTSTTAYSSLNLKNSSEQIAILSTAPSNGTYLYAPNGTGSYLGFWTLNSEKMRIPSTGNVLVGTTTDNGTDKLQVNGSMSDVDISRKVSVAFSTTIGTGQTYIGNLQALVQLNGLSSGTYLVSVSMNGNGSLYWASRHTFITYIPVGSSETYNGSPVNPMQSNSWYHHRASSQHIFYTDSNNNEGSYGQLSLYCSAGASYPDSGTITIKRLLS